MLKPICYLEGRRKIRDPEMEKKLYAWYVQLKNEGIPVTPKMITKSIRYYKVLRFHRF